MAKRKAFGEVKHRKWYKGSSSKRWRRLTASIDVRRVGDTGKGGRTKPYEAEICIGRRRGQEGGPRLGDRCNDALGYSPTKAIKGALRKLAKNFR